MSIKLVRKTTDEIRNPNEPFIWHIKERELYLYDSEKTKLRHKTQIGKHGWEDEGVNITNLGTITNPDYVWCGWYQREVVKNKLQ